MEIKCEQLGMYHWRVTFTDEDGEHVTVFFGRRARVRAEAFKDWITK